ncbi:sugar transferase [Campylobacter jejuni]|nr:sugar transferase [Campylobacter jejuni]
MHNSAVERVKNQLAYKLGQALIEFDKTIENRSLMGGGMVVYL